ncbi:sensor histidine kinase [Cohnella abietis]|uniref:histidine kinase n=1 Tax=Cohnella abietis TaxID=2507935 RepID=A0A3T1CZZ4_9BACL|nr:HAMP domain-containing sensor histidine kinase [Cohnella abietis]BBI31398.1 hypothetical protein KCTCHS21_07970 [Cohnella abietis]
MKNKLLAFLTGKRNIRVQMIWASFLSFWLAFIVAATVPIKDIPFFPYQLMIFIAGFFFTFFFLTRKTIRYLLTLGDGLTVISQGNLHYRIPMLREDELGKIAENINAMAEKLESQIEKERQAEKSKMELITGVSHDLRTPLTSIIGYMDLLKDKAYQDEAEYERFVGNAYNKAIQLKMLIDELFEYTRLTSNEVKLKLERIDLRELLSQMIVEFEPLAKENEVSLETGLIPQSLFLVIDPEQIRRAIDNLLMNALKFTVKPGFISIGLTILRDGSRTAKARITIENKGIPITKVQEERLFERFYKADDSRSNPTSSSGSGLGLSITRSIIELHGGEIYFNHSAGQFYFGMELPLQSNF